MSRIILVVGLALAPALAGAQSVEEDVTRGRSLAKRAQTAFIAGRHGDALSLFQEAYTADPRPVYLFSIAAAAEKAGRLAMAHDQYRRFLNIAPDSPRAARAREAIQRVGEAMRNVRPEVVVDSVPSRAEIFVDAVHVGQTPLRAHVDPGRHAVLLRLEGYQDARFDLDAVKGKVVQIQRTLVEVAPAEAPVVEAPPVAMPEPTLVETPEPPPAGKNLLEYDDVMNKTLVD